MIKSLPDRPNISLLKKQAKKLLKQHRDKDYGAITTVNTHHPKPENFSGLRDAQLVIARSYGFSGWAALSDAVELIGLEDTPLAEKAELFIQLGCLQYSGNDTLRNIERARRLLVSYPDLASYSYYTALVANNVKRVKEYLNLNSSLAEVPGGPLDWPPLLYAVYSRINEPAGSQNSIAIVKLLLENGADPNSHVILNSTCRFTALTGCMGEGEQGVNQPPHRFAEDLAVLLLNAGANPNDVQGLYNTMFTDNGDKWLALLLSHGLKATDATTQSTLDYQLSCAADANRVDRVKTLLAAGSNPNTVNGYNGRAVHSNALLSGHDAIATLLEDAGAVPEELDAAGQFRVSCVQENDRELESLLSQHPHLIEDASLLYAAAERCSDRILYKLLGLGFDINGQANHGRTLLHYYALRNDARKIKYLIDLGARTDIRDSSHDSTPIGFAAYSGSYEAMEIMLEKTDDIIAVAGCACEARARTLLEENPELARLSSPLGNTPLHVIGLWLHDEPGEEVCRSLVHLLLSAGASIGAKNQQGLTPAEHYQALGSDFMFDLLNQYQSNGVEM